MFFVFSSLVCRLTISFSISLLRERIKKKKQTKEENKKTSQLFKEFLY